MLSSQTAKLSSSRVLMGAATFSARLFPQVLKTLGIRLLLLHLAQFALGQFTTFSMETVRESGREDFALLASVAGLELAFNVLWSAAWILTIASGAQALMNNEKPESFATSMIRHFNQVVIEQVRSMASVLWRVPFLILPAIIEYVRLTFVPFVAVLDHDYEKGKVDALKSSRDLSRGHFWLLAFYAVVTLVITWFVQQIAEGSAGSYVWVNPIGVLVGTFVNFFVAVYFTLVLFALYRGVRYVDL